MKKIILACAAAVLISAGCSTSQDADDTAGYSVKSGNQVLEVKADSSFNVELVSQMSTGFSWKLVTPFPAEVTLEGESVKQYSDKKGVSGGEKAGAPELQVFRFKVKKGEYTLTFIYAEHWKRKPDYRETCTVKIIAK